MANTIKLSDREIKVFRSQGLDLSEMVLAPNLQLSDAPEGMSGVLEYRALWTDCVTRNYPERGSRIILCRGQGTKERTLVLESVTCNQLDSYQGKITCTFRPLSRAEGANIPELNPEQYANVTPGSRIVQYQTPVYSTSPAVWQNGSAFFPAYWQDATSTLVGSRTWNKVYHTFTLTLWEKYGIDASPSGVNGYSGYLNKVIEKFVPGFGRFRGTCRAASSVPTKTSGWVNTYEIENYYGGDTPA